MRLNISHRTEYAYDAPVYALQRLRLVPMGGRTQTINSWSLAFEGATEEARFLDHFDNDTRLVSMKAESRSIVIEAGGEVETHDTAGVWGEHRGFAPLWLFQQDTALTAPGDRVGELAAELAQGSELDRLHRLMSAVSGRVEYIKGATDTSTTAEQALQIGSGVCQDHAHVFTSTARRMGFPARYVSGYLLLDATANQVASHAWAEAYVPMLGWVAFDPSNGISPDERYVRLAVGLDFRDANPVSGIRLGWAQERLAVSISVEQ